jgi:hypothetical protein
MADEIPPPLERPTELHLSGGVRIQRDSSVRLRWINRAPAQIAILLIALSALIGMVAQWESGHNAINAAEDARKVSAGLQRDVERLQNELLIVSKENACRSQFSIAIQAAQGNLSADIGKGLAAGLLRDPNRDPSALAQALDDASQAVLDAVASRQQTEAVCVDKPGDHP